MVPTPVAPFDLGDGLGLLHTITDPQFGAVTIRDLPASLSTPAAEQAIQAHLGHFADVPPCAGTLRVERRDEGVRVTARTAQGVRLSEVMTALASNRLELSESEIVDVAMTLIRATAATHLAIAASHGTPYLAHGAIMPAHVLLTREGGVLLTDPVYAAALEALHGSREQLWRRFGLAMPPAAGLLRFDQRSDVSQLGFTVAALFFRRPFSGDEYPRAARDIVAALRIASSHGTALMTWVQQALQLDGRAAFRHAGDAEASFASFASVTRRAAMLTVQRIVRVLAGDGDSALKAS